jgi:hypothetical protein
MTDKQKDIENASAEVLEALKGFIPSGSEDIVAAMRRCMDPMELQMFDLATFYEQEVLMAQQAGAHLAACLMCGAMNEALLALMCLKYEPEVTATSQYRNSTRKKPRPFRDVIGDWHFEQFINVAEERDWIPADIVDDRAKTALADGFRELMPITHPAMTKKEIERSAQAFFQYPGTALLRFTQDLRNAIHAGRWMRTKRQFVAEHFAEWCRFGTLLAGEVRMCLLHLIMKRDSSKAAGQLAQLNEMLDQFPPQFRKLFEDQLRTKLNGS